MRLLESLLTGKSWQSVASSIEDDLKQRIVKLGRIPATQVPNGSKTLLQELSGVAVEWTLKGLGGVTAGGEVALEVGVCAIRSLPTPLRSDEESNITSLSNRQSFHIDEPIVIKAFEKIGFINFLELTNEDPERIGLMFEDFVAINYAAVCSVLDSIEGIPERFKGPWIVREPDAEMRREVRIRNGYEPYRLKEILESVASLKPGLSLLFPGTLFGGDIIVVARRLDGTLLIMIIQCKAALSTSTEQAMNSLRLPYHINRAKNPTLPKSYEASVEALHQVMDIENVSVVFTVFKFPAWSKANYPEVRVVDYVIFVPRRKLSKFWNLFLFLAMH